MKLGDYAREIVAIARAGLARQAKLDPQGNDETVYLEELAANVEASINPATSIIRRWEGEWDRRLDLLIEAVSYR